MQPRFNEKNVVHPSKVEMLGTPGLGYDHYDTITLDLFSQWTETAKLNSYDCVPATFDHTRLSRKMYNEVTTENEDFI